MKLALLVAGLILTMSMLHAEKAPQWEDFDALFGKKSDSIEVTDFTLAFKLQYFQVKSVKGFKEAASAYYVYINFENGSVESIRLRVAPWPKNDSSDKAVYSQKLPFGLLPTDKMDDLIRKLGVPAHPYPNGNFWSYKDHSITIDLTKDTGTIEEIWIKK